MEKADEIGKSFNQNEQGEQYEQLVGMLERLEESHEQRVEAGIDKDDPRLLSKKNEETFIQIEESLGMHTQTEGDRQIEDLLRQIQKAENDIIDLNDLKNRAEKTKKYREKKGIL